MEPVLEQQRRVRPDVIPGWVWRWELTPLEAFRGFKFWRMPEGESVSGEGIPFCRRRLPPCSLPGHGNLTYQFGVATSAPATGQVQAPFILGLREAQPTLQKACRVPGRDDAPDGGRDGTGHSLRSRGRLGR